GSVAVASAMTDAKVSGGIAYLATSGGLYIYDVSNPSSIAAVSGGASLPVAVASTYSADHLALQGKYLYVTIHSGATNAIQVFDVSNPGNPVAITGAVSLSGSNNGLILPYLVVKG